MAKLAAAEEIKAHALQTIRASLPGVVDIVRRSSQALADHGSFGPSLAIADTDAPRQATARGHTEAERSCTSAADALGLAIQDEALSNGRPVAAVRGAANELLGAASSLYHSQEQLNATLSAHSGAHNQQRCLFLRILSIDELRFTVFGNLSLRALCGIRRVCSDFNRWSLAESEKLSARSGRSRHSFRSHHHHHVTHSCACQTTPPVYGPHPAHLLLQLRLQRYCAYECHKYSGTGKLDLIWILPCRSCSLKKSKH